MSKLAREAWHGEHLCIRCENAIWGFLKRVAQGDEIVITRHDKPVARIVPEGGFGGEQGRRPSAALLNLQRSIARRTKGTPLTDADVRSAIEEGRRRPMIPTRFVTDASVAIVWAHPGQATASTQVVFEAIAAGAIFEVPSLWPLEVANALLVHKRRGRITERERRLAAENILSLPHLVDGDGGGLALTKRTDLAAKHGLSIYDAAYLELPCGGISPWRRRTARSVTPPARPEWAPGPLCENGMGLFR